MQMERTRDRQQKHVRLRLVVEAEQVKSQPFHRHRHIHRCCLTLLCAEAISQLHQRRSNDKRKVEDERPKPKYRQFRCPDRQGFRGSPPAGRWQQPLFRSPSTSTSCSAPRRALGSASCCIGGERRARSVGAHACVRMLERATWYQRVPHRPTGARPE